MIFGILRPSISLVKQRPKHHFCTFGFFAPSAIFELQSLQKGAQNQGRNHPKTKKVLTKTMPKSTSIFYCFLIAFGFQFGGPGRPTSDPRTGPRHRFSSQNAHFYHFLLILLKELEPRTPHFRPWAASRPQCPKNKLPEPILVHFGSIFINF